MGNDHHSWKRGFWSLIAAQFRGAFNENGLRNLVVFLVLGMGLDKASRDHLVLVVGMLFSVPFIVFSMTGGSWQIASASAPSPSGQDSLKCGDGRA